MTEFETPYVKKFRKGLVGSLVAIVLLGLLFGAMAVFIGIRPTYEKLTTGWEQVEATAVDEGSRKVRTGGRRSRHTVDRRTVTFEYTVNGVQHRSRVDDRQIQVGDEVMVWVSEKDATEISLAKPTGPSGWNWVGTAVGLVVIAGFALGIISNVHRQIALRGFSPDHAKGSFVLDVRKISDSLENPQGESKDYNVRRSVSGVMATSNLAKYPNGASARIHGRGVTVPPQHELAGPHEGYHFYNGWATDLVMVRRQGSADWWVGELSDVVKEAASTQ
ncbi:MAG TPA: DUF3592 domain-containing protein [Candidatus Avipropionibacterium avicola]|uniref:DUF3592 domain-containing protein n=1 Tax=Candidatus Avipropionibacterium avicola TaxID=2840701 RepID=A0A9D1GYS2_9ACTN|nr:DUF3592 domain-containing protein [Candidatus Avipropionibacterium avicola]